MASNSATPNEGGSRDGRRQQFTRKRNKNAATWNLLTKYIDRFVKEEDYNEYTNIIQQATGASDEVIATAIRFLYAGCFINCAYSNSTILKYKGRL